MPTAVVPVGEANVGDLATVLGTRGLIGYLDGGPVGWCAVEPRTAYEGLRRNNRVMRVDLEHRRCAGPCGAVCG